MPYKNPNNYVKLSGRLAEQLATSEPNGAIWANQFDNVANRQAHIETTAPEIWRRPMARSTASSAPSAPAARWPASRMGLKAKNKNIQIALADPMGAALYNYYKHGELKSEGSSITEGIGQGRITANLEGAVIDDAFQIPDDEAVAAGLRSAPARRPVPRRLDRHQRRRRHPAGETRWGPATPS